MPAGYANHICAYCRVAPSTRTGDHIFARGFFPEDRRANLPKAPACQVCGNRKSEHEHYLATVLPFGGMHSDARRSLETLVPPRLEKNRRLKRALAEGIAELEHEQDGLPGIPFETDRLRALFRMIAQGLLWHHSKVHLPVTHDAISFTPPDESLEQLAKHFLAMRATRIDGDVGEGTFRYLGLISPEDPYLTIWFFQIMGGLRLTGDPERPEAIVSAVVALTGSLSTIGIVRRTWLRESA